jgi:hypothetical protein
MAKREKYSAYVQLKKELHCLGDGKIFIVMQSALNLKLNILQAFIRISQNGH